MADPKETTADKTPSLPTFTTDELEIDPTAMEPMGHGGHSLVFKVKAKGFPHPSVLKIFRFTLPPNPASSSPLSQHTTPRDPDYQYFLSEKTSYSLLRTSPVRLGCAPGLHAVVTISPSFEPYLFQYFNPNQHRRRRQAQLKLQRDQLESQLPLKGVLIEYIHGLRLSAFHWIPASISQKIIDGMEYMHSKGILHRDVKKRNVLIVPEHSISISAKDADEEKTARDIVLSGSEQMLRKSQYSQKPS
ncbi:hypothetical protein H072_9632 [Dactylellina haptotyla CBS 200.50]|uniref:Protein kinase domain-containing protein n=1 Tax=Dactylellina haptotyla (strain CBS 200.50) TaxID=1284197 RepID=S8A1N4_DACHA|nr:hypothetical protein H072_9632 [Dactylellina haptotyla CBS 200.50]